MAELKKFFKEEFPGLKKYKEQFKKYFLLISFFCDYGEIHLAISNKDNHIFNLNFESNIMIQKIDILNQQFTEYLEKKGDENNGQM